MSDVSKRRLYTALAVLAWCGLAIQLEMVLLSRWTSGASLVGGLVSYFSFFTILTNTLGYFRRERRRGYPIPRLPDCLVG